MSSHVRSSSWRFLLERLLLGFVALWLLTVTGCGGCVQEDPQAKKKREDEEKKKKKKGPEKPKDDYSFDDVRVQPNEFMKDRTKINYAKRGHWVMTTQLMKANNFNVQGELVATTTNANDRPYGIENTPFSMAYSRPVALPKGQVKPVESLFYLPRNVVPTQSINLRNNIVRTQGGPAPLPQNTVILPMAEWEYLFVVLSPRASVFSYLDQTQTFAPFHDSNTDARPPIRNYRLLRPVIEKSAPLPTSMLTWTSIAVILWDDLDPALLTLEQQQALIDWIHWGGVLIVNGPNSIDRLRNTFLEPLLPITEYSAQNLEQADFDDLNGYWSRREGGVPNPLKLAKPLAGLRLTLREDSSFLPNVGSLAAERYVGRGRLVLTAFPLNSAVVQNWRGFDSFLNSGMLRRPARKFVSIESDGSRQVLWAANELAGFRHEARLNSNLRFFSRDVAMLDSESRHPYRDRELLIDDDTTFNNPQFNDGQQDLSSALRTPREPHARFTGWMATPRAGVGGWNEFSGTAIAARDHVIDAAGIRIPSAGFVMQVLAAYLFVLVPLNWTLFRLMNRVEWAWIAAPIIAIVGGVTIVRLAHLDIGFVRSRTEIDVVEMHGSYPRAHVARYVNLYTALSSSYELAFDDPLTFAQPFPEGVTFQEPFGSRSQIRLERETDLRLTGFKVESNSQGMLHIENVVDLGGGFEYRPAENEARLKNGSSLECRDVRVIRRTFGDGRLEVAKLDLLGPKEEAALKFIRVEENEGTAAITAGSSMFAQRADQQINGELRLSRFARLAVEQLRLAPGEARLIAWSPREVPGVRYSPDTNQTNAATFLCVHLTSPPEEPAERDANWLANIQLNSNTNVNIAPPASED